MVGEQGFEPGIGRGKRQIKCIVKLGKGFKAIGAGRDYERAQRGAGCNSGLAAAEQLRLPTAKGRMSISILLLSDLTMPWSRKTRSFGHWIRAYRMTPRRPCGGLVTTPASNSLMAAKSGLDLSCR